LRIHKREEREFELTFRMDTLFDGESKLDKMTFKEEKHCECVCVIFVGSGGQEFSFICIRAIEVLVKLVKCYCLGTDLSDFVYKHWAGCLEGKEVTALSEP